MRQMEQEQKKAREEIVRVSQTNLSNFRRQSLRERTEDLLGVIYFEILLLILEDKVESLAVDVSRLPTRSSEGIHERMETSIEAFRKLYRAHFPENFTNLLTAVERLSLDRRGQLTEADLQGKISDLG